MFGSIIAVFSKLEFIQVLIAKNKVKETLIFLKNIMQIYQRENQFDTVEKKGQIIYCYGESLRILGFIIPSIFFYILKLNLSGYEATN